MDSVTFNKLSAMKGIFLTVVDEKSTGVLQTTEGGCPHITFVYTGSSYEPHDLKQDAETVFDYLVGLAFSLVDVKMNSFEKNGKMRYDLLASLDKDSCAYIEYCRRCVFPLKERDESTCIMRDPHVTVGTYWSEDEATARLNEISDKFPLAVAINGVTMF